MGQSQFSQQESWHRSKVAAIEGMHKSTLPAGLILCCMRGDSYEVNADTIRVAAKYMGKGVCAVDLAGAEALFPTVGYSDVFKLARELNVPFEIHAGEADGPSSIYSALEFGATRIGHGVRSIEETVSSVRSWKIRWPFLTLWDLN